MTVDVTASDLAAPHIRKALTATLEAFRVSAARCPAADQVQRVDEALAELLAARNALTGRALEAQPMCRPAQPASVHTDSVGGPTPGCDLTPAEEVAPSLPAALDVCGRLLAEHEAAASRRIGVRVDGWRYTGEKPLAHVEIDAYGALADDTDQVLMADLRALYEWLGVTPTVRTNGSDTSITLVEATVTRDGIEIKIGALTRKLTVDEARAALGLPTGNGEADRADAEGLAVAVEASPDADVCVLCTEKITPGREVLDCGYGPEHPGCHQDAPDAHPDELSRAER